MLRPIRNKVCVVCGKPYATQSPTQLRCFDCIEHMLKKCAKCGLIYVGGSKDTASRNRAKYCDKCRVEVKQEKMRNRMIPQSDEARLCNKELHIRTLKASLSKRKTGYETSPRTATGSIEHSRAKEWILLSPQGITFHVKNLSEFIRQNQDEFPSFNSALQSFYRISKTMSDPLNISKPTYTFRGWSLVCPSDFPKELQEKWNIDKQRKEIMESKRKEKRKTTIE